MVGSWTTTSKRKNMPSVFNLFFCCTAYKGEGGGDGAAGVGR